MQNLFSSEQNAKLSNKTIKFKVSRNKSFPFNHNSTQYLIDPYLFSSFSDLFRIKYFEEKITEFSLKDKTPDRIFTIFINLSQGDEEGVVLSDLFALKRLGNQWKCPKLLEDLDALLATQPENEIKLADFVDNYHLTGKVPKQNAIKTSEIESFAQLPSFHFIDKYVLMYLMQLSKRKSCNPTIINGFITEHCKLSPDDSTEIAQYLDPESLDTSELAFLSKCPGTMMLRIIQDELLRRNQTTLSNKPKDDEEEDENIDTEVNKKGPFLKITPPLYGIFASIGVACGGDPVLKGKIRITASSNDPRIFLSKNDETFQVDGIDPYIQFMFSKSFKIAKYQIKNTSSTIHGLEWSLYGSTDLETWELIHQMNSTDVEFEPNEIKKIELDNESKSFSAFRLKKFSKNETKTYLNIKYFEFFNNDYPDGVSRHYKYSVITSNNALHRLASPRHKANWCSINQPGQWVQFELVRNMIRLDYYTLKSGRCWFPRSWEVLGSADGREWVSLDKKENMPDLCSKYTAKMWGTTSSLECKFVKIVQIGETEDKVNILCLSGVEFFGRLSKR